MWVVPQPMCHVVCRMQAQERRLREAAQRGVSARGSGAQGAALNNKASEREGTRPSNAAPVALP